MHTVTFYPLGNADSYLLQLATGRVLLFDYSHLKAAEDEADKRIDLAAALRERLDEQHRDSFDIVAFTHLDRDHVGGAPAFFHLEHAPQYQGGGRPKINELWVPAAAIVEDIEELGEDAAIINAEARHRFRQGKGIRVFSRPDALKDWLSQQGLSLADRAHLITDAGKLVPGFEQAADGVEFFVHSPFASWCDGTIVERNTLSLVLQATFVVDGQATRFLLSADAPFDLLAEMVAVTKAHGNEQRLAWDLFKLPHHCSYLSLGPDKGKDVTEPVEEVAWLLEQGATGGILISTSAPIPSEDTDQPPHRQAAAYYRGVADGMRGEFKVTMEHPTTERPEPLVVTIGRLGPTIEKRGTPSAYVITSRPAPRAG